ncbi:MAG TPA: chromate efflux transporter [Anaerolineae bacterium]|nr:chromate efflux transporter [Anaerolineae bacterium]
MLHEHTAVPIAQAFCGAHPMTNELLSLARLFAKLSLTSFGGPAAHTAMMEDEIVVRRRWLSRQSFLDLVGAANLIPGPNSTEVVMHIGHLRARWPGLVVAGTSFILPASLITGVIAWFYVRYGALPQIESLLTGIRPVVIAIIAGAIWRLGRQAAKNWQLVAIGLAVAAAALLGFSEVLAMFLGGLMGMIWLRGRAGLADRRGLVSAVLLALALIAGVTAILTLGVNASQLWADSARAQEGRPPLGLLGMYFLFIGSVLYGTGYVLFAFLEGGLVNTFGWLTEQQLIDAIAVGQLTPGPLFSSATFIGYVIAGWPGAVVATVGIFLPSFVFVAALTPLIPKMRRSAWMAAFLDAINVSAIGLMVIVCLQLGRTTLVSWQAWLLLAVALILGLRWKVNSAFLIAGGAIAGWLMAQI